MGRSSLPVAVALLAAAGAGFAWVGWRSVGLERADAQRRDRARSQDALVALGALPLSAAAPSEAVESWRLDAPPVDGTRAASEQDRLLLDEAEFRERARDDLPGALALLDRLASPDPPTDLARVAAGRGGALARRAGDAARARRLLEIAAAADAALGDPGGCVVRFAALRHLAALDFEAGGRAWADRLLAESMDGRRLRADAGLGAGDAVVALAAAPPTEPDLSRRLAAAAQAARRGHDVLAVAGTGSARLLGDRLVWRDDAGLHALPLADFGRAFPTVETTFGVRVGAASSPDDVPPGAVTTRLPATFGDAILHARPATPGPAGSVWVPVAIGLGVYALGTLLVVRSLVRQAHVARMQTDFVAAVSHEMKTPVAAVQAMAERLADGSVAEPARARLYAERIHAEMLRLGTSVRNVLDAARIERGAALVRPAPSEPSVVVSDAAEAVRPVLEKKGFRFEVDAHPAPHPLPIDADALRSVLGNLLDNAAKFSTDRREVVVRAHPVASGFRIEVLDRGPGVPPADRQRVFERFFRGDEAKRGAVPGLGLGLHVARELVLAHGGSLTVSEREGGGAVFVVDLPEAA